MARAGWTWSADLRFESWEDLARQLRMEQSMSVCSIVYGSDVGGCTAPLKENGQAYLRWLQAGCFNFLTRSHCAGVDKHPWNYGSTIEAFAKKILEWKYMLLPYIYTAAYEMHQTGYPLHRPLVLSYPSDSSVYNKADEFMFGDWMLIAPVINGNNDTGNSDTARNIYLPAGTWVDYKDGKTIYKGPLTLNNYSAPLDIVPIFVKAGAIIPMQPVMEYVGQRPIDLLTLDIYPAGYSSYIMYEDDEETYDYLNGAYCKTKYECVESGTIVKVKINSRVGSYTPDNRDYMLKVHNRTGGILDVKLNGTSLPQTTYSALSGGSKGYAPDADKKLVWVRIDDTGVDMSVEIMYKN